MENNTQSHIGPAVAIVIIIGIIATAGIFFYRNMIQDFINPQEEYTVNDTQEANTDTESTEDQGLSTSTDLDSIEQDLSASGDPDLSLFDELDENLLSFEDLEDFNFDLEENVN